MHRAIKIRLYPTNRQKNYINSLIGSSRVVYNLALAYKIDEYNKNKTNINLKDLGKKFHNDWLKDSDLTYLTEHNTKVLKQSLRNMLGAYTKFFKQGNGFPNFKSKHRSKLSVNFPLETISKTNDYLSNHLTFTKQLKDLKFKTSDRYKRFLNKNKSGIKSATIQRYKSGKYFMSILVDTNDTVRQPKKPINHFIGIDLGIKELVITSDGRKIPNPKFKTNEKKTLDKLYRSITRKVKGSKNREKARIKLAINHEKINNRKENYLHHITNQLIDENQVISIEDLDVKSMLSKHNIAKYLQETSLYKLKSMLLYKAEWYGREIVKIDRYFPSSKRCNHCGNINNKLSLSDRQWACPLCKTKLDRDINAAKNIRDEGLKIYKNKQAYPSVMGI